MAHKPGQVSGILSGFQSCDSWICKLRLCCIFFPLFLILIQSNSEFVFELLEIISSLVLLESRWTPDSWKSVGTMVCFLSSGLLLAFISPLKEFFSHGLLNKQWWSSPLVNLMSPFQLSWSHCNFLKPQASQRDLFIFSYSLQICPCLTFSKGGFYLVVKVKV